MAKKQRLIRVSEEAYRLSCSVAAHENITITEAVDWLFDRAAGKDDSILLKRAVAGDQEAVRELAEALKPYFKQS